MQDQAYLTNKRVLLNGPGYSYADSYASVMNSSSSLVETTYTQNTYTASLSSLSFGSTSNINIPNENLLSTCYLTVSLPALTANQTLPRGWLWALINYTSWIFGSSNTSQISLTGSSLLAAMCAECESEEQRSELFNLGGQEQLGATVGPVSATIPLLFPWSKICAALPFDTNLLTNNIVITISLNQAGKIYGGSDAVPNSLLSAIVGFRQGNFSNKANSLKTELARNPTLQVNFPFTHMQSFSSPTFQGSTSIGSPCQINLTSFINSDLTGIVFYIVKLTDLNPVGGNSPSPFNMSTVSNINLTYNGQIIFFSPGNADRVYAMHDGQMATYFMNSVIRPGAVAPFNSDAVNSYPTYIDLSHHRSPCDSSHMFNTMRLSNQVLQLTFTTIDTSTYQLFATYFYNGLCTVENGQSYIYFD